MQQIHIPAALFHAGVVLPLLQQSVMFFNLGLSYFVLKKDLKWEQIGGACLVVAGVLAAAWPSDSGTSVFAQARDRLSHPVMRRPLSVWRSRVGCSLGRRASAGAPALPCL
jgi:hypothetical protein